MADTKMKASAAKSDDSGGKTFKEPAVEAQTDLSKEYDGPGLSTAARDRVMKDAGLGPRERDVKVEVAPSEAAVNGANWSEGRDPLDVVEVAGQRETVEARMARNGQASPQKRLGATTLH
jgi:hypothetical protein